MRTLVVLLETEGLSSLPAALAFAAARAKDYGVLCLRRDDAPGLEQVSRAGDDMPDLVKAARALLESRGQQAPPLFDCRGRNPARALIHAIAELEADHIIVPVESPMRSVPALLRKLIRILPVETFVVGAGGMDGPPIRTIIPQIDGGGALALRHAAKYLTRPDAPALALADPTAQGRSRRVYNAVREKLSEDRRGLLTQSESEGSVEAAVGQAVESGDLILLDAEDMRQVSRAFAMAAALRKAHPEASFAIGLIRAADAIGPGRTQRAIERLRLHAPTLNRDQRRDLVQKLDSDGSVSANFVVMLMLSASIATLGLIQSSAGVVIGAMLVAPLMTPLLAIGLSLVQGNAQLFGKACRAVAIGVLGATLASMAIGLLSPWDDLSAEVVARGAPNPFDLLIALLSGVAAAFALARPGLVGMLVGVAIAVALVPPLAAAGIATVKQHPAVALGAATLFLTNLFAIIVGAALVFRFFGLDASRRGRATPRWTVFALLLLLIAMAPITTILFRNFTNQIDQGVHRPYARPLSPAMRAAIIERVARSPGVDIILMAESEIEHGFGREVLLSSEGPADPALAEDLCAILRMNEDQSFPVRVLFLQAAAPDPAR